MSSLYIANMHIISTATSDKGCCHRREESMQPSPITLKTLRYRPQSLSSLALDSYSNATLYKTGIQAHRAAKHQIPCSPISRYICNNTLFFCFMGIQEVPAFHNKKFQNISAVHYTRPPPPLISTPSCYRRQFQTCARAHP